MRRKARNYKNKQYIIKKKPTLKYRREITPDIRVQADKIFVTNDLFEQAIKSCEAINI